MGQAVIIGGTGAIGRATARRLLAAGWSADLIGRNPARMPPDIAAAGGRFIAAGRAGRGRLEAAFGDGADLLVDCACYTAQPFVLDMTAAAGLGYIPAGDYAATVASEVDWLVTASRGGQDADLIPGPGDSYFAPLLDYLAEDRWLAARMAGAG